MELAAGHLSGSESSSVIGSENLSEAKMLVAEGSWEGFPKGRSPIPNFLATCLGVVLLLALRVDKEAATEKNQKQKKNSYDPCFLQVSNMPC